MKLQCYLFFFISVAIISLEATIQNIYVYPDQKDDNLTLRKKEHRGLVFHSIFEARDAIRRVRRGQQNKSPIVVELRGGTHYLDRTFELDSRDSAEGSSTSTIYRSYKDERATLTGGVRITPESFVSSSVPNIVKVNLFEAPYNFTREDLGTISNPYPSNMAELYHNGKPMTIARDPNIADNGTWNWAGYEHMSPINDVSFKFTDRQTGAYWKGALEDLRVSTPDVWIHGYFKYDWKDTYVKLDSIELLHTNTSNGTIYNVTISSETKPHYPWIKGCRFYVFNALLLLDTPGEYFLDRDNGALFFYPPKPLSKGDDIFVSFLQSIVKASGADHTSFVDLAFEFSRSTALALYNISDLSLNNITIANSGGGCLHVSGSNSKISNSILHGCGSYGIRISGGNILSLKPSQLHVVKNTIYDFSRITRTYEGAVMFSGVGIYVANNTISKGPHTGIMGSGANNLFEFNFISRVSYECTDTGAFYTGRSWAQRGNVARYNTFDHVRSIERLSQKDCSQIAFYIDDQMSGWDFYGNVIQNCNVGVFIGGGRHNKIHDNYFENNSLDIHVDNRGMTWQNQWCLKDCSPSMKSKCLFTALRKVNYTFPPYSTKFPELVDIYDYHPGIPVGNIIEDNRYCHNFGGNVRAFIRARKYVSREQFFDVDGKILLKWYSSLSNNREYCRPSETFNYRY